MKQKKEKKVISRAWGMMKFLLILCVIVPNSVASTAISERYLSGNHVGRGRYRISSTSRNAEIKNISRKLPFRRAEIWNISRNLWNPKCRKIQDIIYA